MEYGGREVYGGGVGPEDGPGAGQVPDAEAAEGNRAEGGANPVGSEKEGFVYFIETEDGRFVKIGYSARVYTRLSQLSTLRPGNFAIRLLGYFPGTRQTESWLHAKFSADRDNGEWFASTPSLRAFIASMGLIQVCGGEPARVRRRAAAVSEEHRPAEAARSMAAKRWAKTTKKQRSEVATKMNDARWGKRVRPCQTTNDSTASSTR